MILTLVGPNAYLLSTEIDKRKADFIENWSDLAVEQLDAEEVEYQKIYDSLTNLPFLVAKKLVILKNPSKNSEFVKAADKLIADLGESTDLIIVETKPDHRSSYLKMLSKNTELIEYPEATEPNLSKWLINLAKQKGGEISVSDSQYLINMVGTNQMRLFNEVKKLISFETKITKSSIDLLVEPTPQSTIFQLLDATFASRTKEVMRIYEDQRAQSVEPQQIIAMLAWQLHILAIVSSAEGKSSADIASTARLNPFVVRKSQQISPKINLSELRQTIKRVLRLDLDLKSKTIDADDALLQLLLSIAS
ncbi:MAG TPA: DNA polymerase III subunit delta [Candidatus Saccharimonadales bacterium]|nr:DNA polymerase III subunit delta [Candidatus Saccharimonadales bacterium]